MKQQNVQYEELVFDIVIVGGGIVGLSLANELIDSGFSIAVVERTELEAVTDVTDCRVSAINRLALERYRQTGVFDSELAARVCAFEKMFVWDQTGAGQIEFDSAELGIAELGAIIENKVLQHLLLDNIRQATNISYMCPQSISSIDYKPAVAGGDMNSELTLSSGQTLQTRLLVGADGVGSRVRQAAAIERVKKNYQQHALVCNVNTSEPHQNTAWQCFMPSGPLALLPMYDGQSSIVWSLDEKPAQEMMALDDAAFKQALTAASEYRLGEVTAVSERFLFPLTHGHVDTYVRQGLALIGDAAHNIHPLAGQGANLGIADAFVLAQVIVRAADSDRQWWAQHTLSRYQRQRKGANRVMETSMTGFKLLFGEESALVAEIRNAGLSLVDHLPGLKHRIIRQALGG